MFYRLIGLKKDDKGSNFKQNYIDFKWLEFCYIVIISYTIKSF
jgi:hypothetical protein